MTSEQLLSAQAAGAIVLDVRPYSEWEKVWPQVSDASTLFESHPCGCAQLD